MLYFFSPEYPVNKRRKGNLSARITLRVKESPGFQANHRQGFLTTPARTTGEFDFHGYAARLLLHFYFQRHEKLSCYILARQRQQVKHGPAIQFSACLISAACEKEIDSTKKIKSKTWPYRSVVKRMEEKIQN